MKTSQLAGSFCAASAEPLREQGFQPVGGDGRAVDGGVGLGEGLGQLVERQAALVQVVDGQAVDLEVEQVQRRCRGQGRIDELAGPSRRWPLPPR